MKYAVFARTRQQADIDFLRPRRLRDRDIVLVTSAATTHRLRGRQGLVYVYLDGWWRDWCPRHAEEAWFYQYMPPTAAHRLEQNDLYRRNAARRALGLPEMDVPDMERFDFEDEKTPRDKWFDSPAGYRFRQMLRESPETLSALPGLDDKPKKKWPEFAPITFADIYDDPERLAIAQRAYLYAYYYVLTHNPERLRITYAT